MNFLELVKKAWEKAGQSGDGPASVSVAAGHQKRFVNWVRDAWIEIQQESSEWSFLKTDKLCSLVSGKEVYSFAELSLGDAEDILALFILIDGRYQPLRFIRSPSSTEYALHLNRGLGRPQACYLANDALSFDVIPDSEYQLKVHYKRMAQELASNEDVPICSAAYHSAIWWKAVKSYARFDEDQALFTEANEQAEKILMQMHRKLKPEIKFGPSAFQ